MCDIHSAKHAHAAASRTAARLKVFRTYRSASCVRSRVRVSPARLASSPCVKKRRATRKKKEGARWGREDFKHSPHSREARRACGTHRCGAAAASCSRVGKSRVRNVFWEGGGTLSCLSCVFLHLRHRHLLLSLSGDQSPRNLRSRRCALSPRTGLKSCRSAPPPPPLLRSFREEAEESGAAGEGLGVIGCSFSLSLPVSACHV